MEIMQDSLKVIGRIVTILPLMLLVALFMGRRSVGELPVFDFLIIIILGAVVGADIADPAVNHIHTAVAIIAIGIVQRLYSRWSIKSTRLRKLTTFEPVVVIRDGAFLKENLRQIEYSVDNVLTMLREKDIFNLADVDTAVIESTGKLTVFKNPDKAAVSPYNLGLAVKNEGMAYPVIIEGTVYPDVLKALGLDAAWLEQELQKQGITDPGIVFFASVDDGKKLYISPQAQIDSPPLYH